MSEQDLIGFDDGPVPQEVLNGKLHVNGNVAEITKTEMVLNSLNTEKSLNGGKLTEIQSDAVNGNHDTEGDYDDTPVNGHLNGTVVKGADGLQETIDCGGAENGEHLYSEVPEKENGEDNIYEEVLPVAARKAKENSEVKHENGSPIYDDSSLSSELSADLSPPSSNTEDATGVAMSDPECDTVMTAEVAAEKAAALIATECERQEDSEVAYEDASSVAKATVSLVESTENEDRGRVDDSTLTAVPNVVSAVDEDVENGQVEGPCYANVDVFVDCVETTEVAGTSEGEHVEFQELHITEETISNVIPTTVPEIGVVKKEHPQLKTGRTETIIDKEIRAQKEREEMIAQERKRALELMKQATSVEKEAAAPPVSTPPASAPKIPIMTTRQTSLNSAPSTPSVSSPAPFPAPVEKRYNCPSDSRIADEIREMREREEELKELRERLQAEGDLVAKDGVQKSNHTDTSEVTNGSSTPSSTTGLSRTMSVESVQSGQGSLSFGSRRKDRITVRPLSDETECFSPTVFSPPNGESPIEREIRMAKDREEALRREKLLLGQLQAEGFVKKSEVTPVAAKPVVNSIVRGPGKGSAQKLLATSRIQQEIEEQTQREIDLRASGHIQTISQERTDSKVTGIGNALVTGRPEETKPLPQPQPAFLANDASIPNIEIYEKTPPATKQITPVSNGKCAGGLTPVTSKNGSAPRAVSMQKFIASRGKELVFTQQPNGSCGTDVGSGLGYCELKPPQVRRGSGADRKGFVTAETKIQEEMRAMKEREEELRRQRTRLMGQVHPNLPSVENGKLSPLGQTSSDESLRTQDNGSDNTDGAEEAQLLSGSDGNNSGCARRRSALIAQWEQRIQKTDTVKS